MYLFIVTCTSNRVHVQVQRLNDVLQCLPAELAQVHSYAPQKHVSTCINMYQHVSTCINTTMQAHPLLQKRNKARSHKSCKKSTHDGTPQTAKNEIPSEHDGFLNKICFVCVLTFCFGVCAPFVFALLPAAELSFH